MYQKKFYRDLVNAKDLVGFQVSYYDSDLQIFADKDLRDEALKLLVKARTITDTYIQRHGEFLESLEPLEPDPCADRLIQEMLNAGKTAGVGPMAAVAGAFAGYVGQGLLRHTKEIIVENGGDLFMKTERSRLVSVFAGTSPLSLKVGIKMPPHPRGIGICTSSGAVGHSISYGIADAVVVIARNPALADAYATLLGNLVKKPEDVDAALKSAREFTKIRGIVVIVGEKLGAWGDIQLKRL